MRKTFVIGDVHGNVGGFIDLLQKAGVREQEHEIVQLGDLGDYRLSTQGPDETIWQFAKTLSNLTVLMGNHEAAIFHPSHMFRGYAPPLPGTVRAMTEVGLLYATTRHGFLLTHAGLHPEWLKFLVPGPNELLGHAISSLCNTDWDVFAPVRDSIGPFRGGYHQSSGILWRDWREPIADHIPQVCGHTRGTDIRQKGEAICIDIGHRDDNNLAGIWLPSLEVVAVGTDAAFIERSLSEQ